MIDDVSQSLMTTEPVPPVQVEAPHECCCKKAGGSSCRQLTGVLAKFDHLGSRCRRYRIALRWTNRAGVSQDLTYQQLKTLTNHFANVLRRLGAGRGDRVFTLISRTPESCVTALGAWKNGCVVGLLPEDVDPATARHQLSAGRATVLVTTEDLYRRVVAALRGSVPALKHVVLVGDNNRRTFEPGTENYQRLMETSGSDFTPDPGSSEYLGLLRFDGGEPSIHYSSESHEGLSAWHDLFAPLLSGSTVLLDERVPS